MKYSTKFILKTICACELGSVKTTKQILNIFCVEHREWIIQTYPVFFFSPFHSLYEIVDSDAWVKLKLELKYTTGIYHSICHCSVLFGCRLQPLKQINCQCHWKFHWLCRFGRRFVVVWIWVGFINCLKLPSAFGIIV